MMKIGTGWLAVDRSILMLLLAIMSRYTLGIYQRIRAYTIHINVTHTLTLCTTYAGYNGQILDPPLYHNALRYSYVCKS